MSHPAVDRYRTSILAAALACFLVACGGGGDPAAGDGPDPAAAANAEHAIVFAGRTDDGYQVFSTNLGDEAAQQLTSGGGGFPVWSPDGDRILFVTANGDLMILDTASGSTSRVLPDNGNPADWGPRGERVLVTIADDDGRGLYILDPATGESERIDTGSNADAYARWGRDGNTVTYESGRDGNPEIYVTHLDNGETTRLTDNNSLDEWPSVSRDGAWIAWASGTEEEKNLWVMRADGTDKRQITEGLMFGDAFPEWSPEGGQILLTVRENDEFVLKLVDLASGEVAHVGTGTAASWR